MDAINNLKEFKAIADLEGMKFMLMEGTLLGAYREHDFIKGDENDIDLGIMENEFYKFERVMIRLENSGFTNTKLVEINGELHGGCWERGDNHVDVMKMIKRGNIVHNIGERGLLKYEYPAEIFDKYSQIEFKGMTFDAPGDIEGFLTTRYGDWKTPVDSSVYSYSNPIFSPNVKKIKLAVYTLTRDRLEYTKRMLEQLEWCDYDFDYFVLDNGSQDGTADWLESNIVAKLIKSPVNLGLWHGIKKIKETTNCFEGYDLVLKLDNDLEFPQDGWLRELLLTYYRHDFDIVSPFVEGICDGSGGPQRITTGEISQTAHVGGACLLCRPTLYKREIPLDRGKAQGWDTWFCKRNKCGIAERIHVKHDTLKQEETNPEYYERKKRESTEVFAS